MLLLLLVTFVSESRLELVYISLIENIRSSLTPHHGFWQLVLLPHFIEIVFSTMVNLLCLCYLTAQRCCLLHLRKQNCLLNTFLRTLILMTQIISLPVFPSKTNLKLHNIYVTRKVIKKVIMNLDLSKLLIVFQWWL